MAERGKSGRVSLEFRSRCAILRFSNMNNGLMDEGTETELAGALDAIESNEDVRSVIATGGDDGMFIRHYDVALLAHRGRQMADRGLTFDPARPVPKSPLHKTFERIRSSPNPFIAAINGTAMGGGFELALACDFRLAEQGAYSIGLPEINAGLLPGAGGTVMLTELLGSQKALEFLLLGKTVKPKEAARLGLVNRVVPSPVLDTALELAGSLAERSPRAVGHIKALVRAMGGRNTNASLAAERTLFCGLMVDEHSLRRMDAVARGEKDIRKP